jgi:hypothetical protein
MAYFTSVVRQASRKTGAFAMMRLTAFSGDKHFPGHNTILLAD